MATEQNLNNDEISIKELIFKFKEWYHFLLSKWKTIFIAGVLGGFLGLSYAIIKKPTYAAETTFVLEEGESIGNLGQYAGLASMVGIDLGGSGGGIFKGDNILELYKSRKMIQETLLSESIFDGKKEKLIDRYLSFNGLKEKWENKVELATISFHQNPLKFTRLQDSVMSLVVEKINKEYLNVSKIDKKLSIISVKVNAKDEGFAKAFTENIVRKVNQFYIDTKTKKSAENLAVLQKQADSVKNVLNQSISGVASAIDANPNSNPAFQRLRVGSQRRQVDVQASGAIYEEIVKNLELAKITFRKETPLIQVIDEPVFPLKNDRLGKAKGIVFGGIILGFLTLLFLFLQKLFKGTVED